MFKSVHAFLSIMTDLFAYFIVQMLEKGAIASPRELLERNTRPEDDVPDIESLDEFLQTYLTIDKKEDTLRLWEERYAAVAYGPNHRDEAPDYALISLGRKAYDIDGTEKGVYNLVFKAESPSRIIQAHIILYQDKLTVMGSDNRSGDNMMRNIMSGESFLAELQTSLTQEAAIDKLINLYILNQPAVN